jgi:hypothetical protein
MNTDLIIEHLDLWTSAVTYNNGKGRGNKELWDRLDLTFMIILTITSTNIRSGSIGVPLGIGVNCFTGLFSKQLLLTPCHIQISSCTQGAQSPKLNI